MVFCNRHEQQGGGTQSAPADQRLLPQQTPAAGWAPAGRQGRPLRRDAGSCVPRGGRGRKRTRVRALLSLGGCEDRSGHGAAAGGGGRPQAAGRGRPPGERLLSRAAPTKTAVTAMTQSIHFTCISEAGPGEPARQTSRGQRAGSAGRRSAEKRRVRRRGRDSGASGPSLRGASRCSLPSLEKRPLSAPALEISRLNGMKL